MSREANTLDDIKCTFEIIKDAINKLSSTIATTHEEHMRWLILKEIPERFKAK